MPRITVAAYRRMVKPIKLRISDIKTVLQISHTLATIEIERRTDIKLSIRSQGNTLPSGVTVIHTVKKHPVGQQIQLYRYNRPR